MAITAKDIADVNGQMQEFMSDRASRMQETMAEIMKSKFGPSLIELLDVRVFAAEQAAFVTMRNAVINPAMYMEDAKLAVAEIEVLKGLKKAFIRASLPEGTLPRDEYKVG